MVDSNSPNAAGQHRADLEEDWALIEALMTGVSRMRQPAYLPQYEAESPEAYKARLLRSHLYPGFKRGLGLLSDRIFSKPLTLSQAMPELIQEWCDDIDLSGNNIDRFARAFFRDAAGFGQSHILIDYTRVPEQASAAEEDEIKPRPYFYHVRALALLDATIANVNGKTRYTYVRFLETREKRDGFKVKIVPRVRELEPGVWRIYEKGKSGWEVVDSGTMTRKGKPLSFVPMISFFPGSDAVDLSAKPPLIDLAYKNLEHFQSGSDQRNILTFARFPMLAVAGQVAAEVDGEGNPMPLVVGPRKVLSTTDPQGKWYYVEPQGAAIEAGRKDLEDLKTEMEMLSFAPLMPKTGDIRATAHAITHSEANTAAQSVALAMKDALDYAISVMGHWAGIEETGAVMLNSDFGLTVAEQERIKALLDMRGRRDLSQKTLWNEMKVNGVLSRDFDPDDEEAALAVESDDMVRRQREMFGDPDDDEGDPDETGQEDGDE